MTTAIGGGAGTLATVSHRRSTSRVVIPAALADGGNGGLGLGARRHHDGGAASSQQESGGGSRAILAWQRLSAFDEF